MDKQIKYDIHPQYYLNYIDTKSIIKINLMIIKSQF